MDRLTKLMESPAFKKRYIANINAAGSLYLRSRLAAYHGIVQGHTFRVAIIKNDDGIFPAIIHDPGGNTMCRKQTGLSISIARLKTYFNMPDNQQVILRKYSARKHKGFLLMHPTDVWRKGN